MATSFGCYQQIKWLLLVVVGVIDLGEKAPITPSSMSSPLLAPPQLQPSDPNIVIASKKTVSMAEMLNSRLQNGSLQTNGDVAVAMSIVYLQSVC